MVLGAAHIRTAIAGDDASCTLKSSVCGRASSRADAIRRTLGCSIPPHRVEVESVERFPSSAPS